MADFQCHTELSIARKGQIFFFSLNEIIKLEEIMFVQ